jgi:hypothetical protein
LDAGLLPKRTETNLDNKPSEKQTIGEELHLERAACTMYPRPTARGALLAKTKMNVYTDGLYSDFIEGNAIL